MKKITLLYSFFLSLFFALFATSFIPNIKIIYFLPFLVILYFNTSFITSLWISFLSGIIVDLISTTHFGINALVFTVLTALFYHRKRLFNLSTLNIFLFTVLLSISHSIFKVFFLFIFDKGLTISFLFFITDVILMSIIDGLYSFLFFALPLKAIDKFKKSSFFTKEKA